MVDRVVIEFGAIDAGVGGLLTQTRAEAQALAATFRGELAGGFQAAKKSAEELREASRRALREAAGDSEHLGVGLRTIERASHEAASGLLLLSSEARGASAEIGRLVAFSIAGFAHGGGLGLGIAAVTSLIHVFGKASADAEEEAAKKAKEHEAALQKNHSAYLSLIDDVKKLQQEQRALATGQPLSVVQAREGGADVVANAEKNFKEKEAARIAAQRRFDEMENQRRSGTIGGAVIGAFREAFSGAGGDVTKAIAEEAKAYDELVEARRANEERLRMVTANADEARQEAWDQASKRMHDAYEKRLAEVGRQADAEAEAEYQAGKKVRAAVEAHQKDVDAADRRAMAAGGHDLALDTAAGVRQRARERDEADKEARLDAERAQRLEDELARTRAITAEEKKRVEEKIRIRDLEKEGATEAQIARQLEAERTAEARRLADEKERAHQSLADEIELMKAATAEERARVELRQRLRDLERQGFSKEDVKAYETARLAQMRREEEGGGGRGGGGGGETTNRVRKRDDYGFPTLKGDQGVSGARGFEDPEAARIRRMNAAGFLSREDQRNAELDRGAREAYAKDPGRYGQQTTNDAKRAYDDHAASLGLGAKGAAPDSLAKGADTGKKADPMAASKAAQDAITKELKDLKDSLDKADAELAQKMDETVAAAKDVKQTTVTLFKNQGDRITKLEAEFKDQQRQLDALRSAQGGG